MSSAQKIKYGAKKIVHENKGEPSIFSQPASKREKRTEIFLFPACVYNVIGLNTG